MGWLNIIKAIAPMAGAAVGAQFDDPDWVKNMQAGQLAGAPRPQEPISQPVQQPRPSTGGQLEGTPSNQQNDIKPSITKPPVEDFEQLQRVEPTYDPNIMSDGNMPQKVSRRLLTYVKGIEGFAPKAVWDNKQYSYGYGMKAPSATATISREQADAMLAQHIEPHVNNILTAAKTKGWNLTPGQVDALASFDYNTGSGAKLIATSSDPTQVLQRMQQYTRASGKVLPGLVRRRQEEARMFME